MDRSGRAGEDWGLPSAASGAPICTRLRARSWQNLRAASGSVVGMPARLAESERTSRPFRTVCMPMISLLTSPASCLCRIASLAAVLPWAAAKGASVCPPQTTSDDLSLCDRRTTGEAYGLLHSPFTTCPNASRYYLLLTVLTSFRASCPFHTDSTCRRERRARGACILPGHSDQAEDDCVETPDHTAPSAFTETLLAPWLLSRYRMMPRATVKTRAA